MLTCDIVVSQPRDICTTLQSTTLHRKFRYHKDETPLEVYITNHHSQKPEESLFPGEVVLRGKTYTSMLTQGAETNRVDVTRVTAHHKASS